LLLLLQDFFEEDEYCNTNTPLQTAISQCTNVIDTSNNTTVHRIPLMQMCNQASVNRDESINPSRDSMSLTSSSLSSQKLKTFAFSRSNRKNVTDSGDLPPTKKPALEKELTILNPTQHTSLDTSFHCSVSSMLDSTSQNDSLLTSTVTTPVSSGSLARRSSTPITMSNNHHIDGAPSLPITPLSRPVVKRKFPGPAGLLPKLVIKLFHIS